MAKEVIQKKGIWDTFIAKRLRVQCLFIDIGILPDRITFTIKRGNLF